MMRLYIQKERWEHGYSLLTGDIPLERFMGLNLGQQIQNKSTHDIRFINQKVVESFELG